MARSPPSISRCSGAAVGLPQRHERALLPVLRGDRGEGRCAPLDGRRSDQGAGGCRPADLGAPHQAALRARRSICSATASTASARGSCAPSNGYQFTEPPDVESSKSENKSGTEGQESFPSLATLVPAQKPVDSDLEAALLRLGSAIRTGASRAGPYFQEDGASRRAWQ